MIGEPRRGITGQPLAVGKCGIAANDIVTILGNGIPEGVVAGKWGALLPTLGQAAQAAQRESLDHRLLEPLAGPCRFGVGLPAVAKHVAQLVAELVGELRPVPLAY